LSVVATGDEEHRREVVAVAVVDRCVEGEGEGEVPSVFVNLETEGEPVLLLSFADSSDHEPHVLAAR